jgi:thiol-disulfide isomerase/thioredoxin
MKKILTVVVVWLAGTAVVAQTSPRSSLRLRSINGQTIALDNYKGSILLINFWATWCVPCRSEIPDLIKLQRRYRNQGLRILGITYPPEQISEVRRFVRHLKINYPVAIGTKATKTQFTASETLPMTVVIDRDGRVREVIEGIMYADEFDQKVRPLLSNDSASQAKGTLRPGKPKSAAYQRAMMLY